MIPRMVLESLGRDKHGEPISVMTGRDGRVLWSGKTKMLRHSPEIARKFTSPWSNLSKSVKRKSARVSYLFRVFSEQRLPVKAVQPLWRLSLQLWKLKMDAFVRITRKILSCANLPICSRRTSEGRFPTQIKPYLVTGSEKQVLNGLITVPLWDWRRRLPPWLTSEEAAQGLNP